MTTTKIPVRYCKEVTADNARNPRNLAHVGHYRNAVCVAPALFEFPPNYVYAVLLHELGHMVKAGKPHSERDADQLGGALARVRIIRRAWRAARWVEYVSNADLPAARRTVNRLTSVQQLLSRARKR